MLNPMDKRGEHVEHICAGAALATPSAILVTCRSLPSPYNGPAQTNKEQMGHSSIQVTVDICGHLILGANVCFVDRLDRVPAEEAETTPQQSATPAQQGEMEVPDILQMIENTGGGGWTRTNDLRIMRPSL